MHEPGSLAHLERAMDQVNLRLEHVRLLVCTHAHSDHYGQAATIVERAGLRAVDAPEPRARDARARGPGGGAAAAHRDRPLSRRARRAAARATRRARGARARRASPRSIEPDRAAAARRRGRAPTSAPGSCIETPGHAPSHVCLFQPERRLLISGDHLLGRISLYYDYGYSPDPVGEFLHSLDVVEALGAAAVPARPRPHVHRRRSAHIEANRALVPSASTRLLDVAARARPDHRVRGGPARLRRADRRPRTANWWLQETLCYLRHLEATGGPRRSATAPDGPERWRAAG